MARSDTARLHTRGLFSGRLSMKGGPCGDREMNTCVLWGPGGWAGHAWARAGAHLVVDSKGGHLHGHGHDIHSAVDQAWLKLLV